MWTVSLAVPQHFNDASLFFLARNISYIMSRRLSIFLLDNVRKIAHI